jgi:hypothetical protein
MNVKHLCLILALTVASSVGYAETRDVNPTILEMFDQGFAPFTDTPDPAVGDEYIPTYIDEGATDGATIDDSPGMYTGAEIGDLVFINVQTANDFAPTVAGWTAVPCSGQGSSTGANRIDAFYQIIASTNPTRLVSINGGDHIIEHTWGMKVGSFNASDPFEDNCSQADLGLTTDVSSASFVTENDNSMVVVLLTSNKDGNFGVISSNFATAGDMTNPYTLEPGIQAINGYGKNTGSGGGVTIYMGIQVTAGAVGVSSGTAEERDYVVISFAINGAPTS